MSWPAWYVDVLLDDVDAALMPRDASLGADPDDDPDAFAQPPPHLTS